MNCLFIINPVSGGGYGRCLVRLLDQCPSEQIKDINKEVLFIDPPSLEQDLLARAENVDVVVIAGGDGSAAQAVHCLSGLKNPPPIAIIPAGTGNDLANSLGWLSVWKNGGRPFFLSNLKNSKKISVDLWSLNKICIFINYVSFGLDAWIVRRFFYFFRSFPALIPI